MAFRLVGQNCAVQITLGGTQDGAPNWAGAATNIKALARRVRVADTADMTDLKTLGDSRRKQQVTAGGSRVEIELAVGDGGFQFTGMLGHYARVELKALSTLLTFDTYEGVISEVEQEMPDGATTERLVIECDANGV